MTDFVVVPWPSFSPFTATGAVSHAKKASKPLPWLSANRIGVLHPRAYREAKHGWREAAMGAARDHRPPPLFPVRIKVCLSKRTSVPMDSFAILEGMKPLLDGFVEAGFLPDDSSDYIVGGDAWAVKASHPSSMGVLVTFSLALFVGDPPSGSSSARPVSPSTSAAGTAAG